MITLIAFVAAAGITFAALVFAVGYSKHMGNQAPTSWPAILGASVAVGLIIAGFVAVIASFSGVLA